MTPINAVVRNRKIEINALLELTDSYRRSNWQAGLPDKSENDHLRAHEFAQSYLVC